MFYSCGGLLCALLVVHISFKVENDGNPGAEPSETCWSLISHFWSSPHPITLAQFFMGNIFGFIQFFYFPSKKTEKFDFFDNLGGKFTARPIFRLNLRPNYPRISIQMHKTNVVALVLRIIKHPKILENK